MTPINKYRVTSMCEGRMGHSLRNVNKTGVDVGLGKLKRGAPVVKIVPRFLLSCFVSKKQ